MITWTVSNYDEGRKEEEYWFGAQVQIASHLTGEKKVHLFLLLLLGLLTRRGERDADDVVALLLEVGNHASVVVLSDVGVVLSYFFYLLEGKLFLAL